MASVWQLSVRHQGSGSSVRGVILKSNPIFHGTRSGGFINMLRVIRSYFIKPLGRKTINLQIDEQEFQATTNSRGEFMFDVESKLGDVKSVELAGQKLEFVFDYPEVFPKGISDYEVISDIDDTIMISYTADTIKRITTLLFTDPLKRMKIDYTHQLYEHLLKSGARVNYVSKSEANLFGLISGFIRFNSFPQGDIFLTPYLGFRQMLLSKKKGSFKEETINKIISNSDRKFILVGDDSQLDMDVYAKTVSQFEDRIDKVYIRQTKNKMTKRAEGYLSVLKDTGVEVIVFRDDDAFEGG